MFKIKNAGLLLLALFIVLVMAWPPVFAAEKASTLGVPDSSGTYGVEVDTSNVINFNGEVMLKYAAMTTSTSITAAQSGTTFVYSPATTTSTATLPVAAVGLNYRFVQAVGTPNNVSNLVLKPDSGDTFVGCGTVAQTSTFAAGDRLISSRITGDSVTIAGKSGTWYCVNQVGSWADNN